MQCHVQQYTVSEIKTFTKLLYCWNEIQDLLEYYIYTVQLGYLPQHLQFRRNENSLNSSFLRNRMPYSFSSLWYRPQNQLSH